MKRKMLSGKDLIKLGYPEGRAIGAAINTVLKYFRRSGKEEIYTMLQNVLAAPHDFINDSIWRKVALELAPTERKTLVQELRRNGVDLIGGGLDEAPMAYKDIRTVMSHQDELVEVLGTFVPKIVRMCGDETPSED